MCVTQAALKTTAGIVVQETIPLLAGHLLLLLSSNWISAGLQEGLKSGFTGDDVLLLYRFRQKTGEKGIVPSASWFAAIGGSSWEWVLDWGVSECECHPLSFIFSSLPTYASLLFNPSFIHFSLKFLVVWIYYNLLYRNSQVSWFLDLFPWLAHIAVSSECLSYLSTDSCFWKEKLSWNSRFRSSQFLGREVNRNSGPVGEREESQV